MNHMSNIELLQWDKQDYTQYAYIEMGPQEVYH